MKKIKEQFSDPTRILTLANMISLFRALLAIPIIYSLQHEYWNIAFILIILAVLSDSLDGYFARLAHEVTHFGKWLDPIADFIVIFAVTSYLVMEGLFPAWFYWFYLGRYVAIALPAIYHLNHNQYILSSNWYGKWAAGITTLAIVLHIYPIEQIDWLPNSCLYVATGLMAVSFIKYIRTFAKHSATK
ncbi:MAG: CDP-alcohol phosphatidyltransferase family protein [Candidatus Marinimicrobia bacterium]|nr:CDP-alcohol phosphatidyltransferase family protein [Candidatus Neomarinimicrobiota bacterium]